MTSHSRRAASAGSNQPPAEVPQEDYEMEEAPQNDQTRHRRQLKTRLSISSVSLDLLLSRSHFYSTQSQRPKLRHPSTTTSPISKSLPPTQHPQVDTILVQLNKRVEQTARDLLQAQGKSKMEHDEALRQHKQA
ncbi:predicted protein [Lichtheimia corymbifera JMRC:FSU:9682]|uniref:Uncharacterized protein n=1 Tax=Lichtheimia corymbifera JMRC:FSU:9682 TaxID=1263082 RepID=A0A068SDY9_9FUNG|nr:predicted protein [Lichtheimia corymbifera JMRC:FSU:9682]